MTATAHDGLVYGAYVGAFVDLVAWLCLHPAI